MRIPFLLAYAEGKGAYILKNINNVSYAPPDYLWHFPRIDFRGQEYWFRRIASVTLAQDSVAESKMWSVALLYPMSQDWANGPMLHRKLRRVAMAAPNGWIKGPFSLLKAATLWPSFANRYLKPTTYDEDNDIYITQGSEIMCPMVFMGDQDPFDIAKIDYNPSDDDCTNDVEPDKDVIIPPVQIDINV